VKLFFPMEPFWEMATVLLAAMPAAALCTVLAQRYWIYVDESAQAVHLDDPFARNAFRRSRLLRLT
jgi:predicted permease